MINGFSCWSLRTTIQSQNWNIPWPYRYEIWQITQFCLKHDAPSSYADPGAAIATHNVTGFTIVSPCNMSPLYYFQCNQALIQNAIVARYWRLLRPYFNSERFLLMTNNMISCWHPQHHRDIMHQANACRSTQSKSHGWLFAEQKRTMCRASRFRQTSSKHAHCIVRRLNSNACENITGTCITTDVTSKSRLMCRTLFKES